jgi:hypothetical protein
MKSRRRRPIRHFENLVASFNPVAEYRTVLPPGIQIPKVAVRGVECQAYSGIAAMS